MGLTIKRYQERRKARQNLKQRHFFCKKEDHTKKSQLKVKRKAKLKRDFMMSCHQNQNSKPSLIQHFIHKTV